jgi:hypothetical protein
MSGSQLEMDADTLAVVPSLTRAVAARDESIQAAIHRCHVAEWRILRGRPTASCIRGPGGLRFVRSGIGHRMPGLVGGDAADDRRRVSRNRRD